MSPSFAYGCRGSQYRYYVAASALPGRGVGDVADSQAIRRVSAAALEATILERLRHWTASRELAWDEAAHLVRRVRLRPAAFDVTLDPKRLFKLSGTYDRDVEQRLRGGDAMLPSTGEDMSIRIAVRPSFRGGLTSLEASSPRGRQRAAPNPALIRGLRGAHRILAELSASPLSVPEQLAHADAPKDFYKKKLAPLAFLSPEIQQAILQGRQPAGLTLQKILESGVPLSWSEQRRKYGFVDASR